MSSEKPAMANAYEHQIEPEAPGEPELIAPRITIEAFCMTEGFATALQDAMQDRRMAKATSAVGMGGIDAAVRRYRDIDAPNLIIVESVETGFELFGELAKLAEVVDERTHVVVAGPSNDIALYRELMRNGVSDYLVTPCAPIQAIESVVGMFNEPGASPAATSFAVYGVRGGVGASVFTHNFAAELAMRGGKDALLIDLDIEFGTVGLNFNVEPKNTIADAYRDIDNLDDVKLARLLHAQQDKLKLLAAPSEVSSDQPPTEAQALSLIDIARTACDLLVLDTPSSWRASSRVALRQASKVILVATPDLVSLRNLRSLLDWLQSARPNDRAPTLVLTQIGQPKRPEISEAEFVDLAGAPPALSLPWDAATYGAALNSGKLLRDTQGGRGHADLIGGFADVMAGREKRAAGGGAGVARLLGAFGFGRRA
ncbi:MAG: AAA family ATPase [Neomegalonema sp.]|nr:AAA family ATPase [Neomegalonema sp.]